MERKTVTETEGLSVGETRFLLAIYTVISSSNYPAARRPYFETKETIADTHR